MDQAVTALLKLESVYLAVAVVIVTFFVRRIVETAVPSAKKKADENAAGITYETSFARWWNSVILYAIPVVAGSGMAMAAVASGWEMLPVSTLGGAAISGGIVGWFSSFLYKVFRKVLKQRTGIDPIPGPASVTNSMPPDKGDDDE